MDKRKVELKMATQMAETPTLYGEDAKQVLREIAKVPTKAEMQKLREKHQKFSAMIPRRNGR
jgi:hypothetical protein